MEATRKSAILDSADSRLTATLVLVDTHRCVHITHINFRLNIDLVLVGSKKIVTRLIVVLVLVDANKMVICLIVFLVLPKQFEQATLLARNRRAIKMSPNFFLAI